MYLHIFCASLISIYSVNGAVITPHPSVIEAINVSSSDVNYKCPYLRSSKLLDIAPDILKNCQNFEMAQSLKKVEMDSIDNGLCILYYNNFINLCYLTNNASKPLLENTIPGLFTENNIDTVCKTLLNNTHIVSNAKPGIDAITERLRSGVCNRLCTDLDGKVKPICSLSAYIADITSKLQIHNKESNISNILVTKNSNTPENARANEPQQNLEGDNKIHVTNNIGTMQDHNLPLLKSDKLEVSSVTTVNSTLRPILSKYILNPALSQDSLKPVNTETSKVTTTLKPVVYQTKINELQNTKSDNFQFISHPIHTPERPQDFNNVDSLHNSNPKIQETNVKSTAHLAQPPLENEFDKQHVKSNNQDGKNLQIPIAGREGEVRTDAQPNIKQDDSVVIQKNPEVPDDDGPQVGIPVGDGDIQDGKEMDDDIEVGDGIAPAGEMNMDYANEVVPKSSEVKTKAEVMKTEKLKPLQTDEERYTISANYQNQNIDDSDSYFFSYFMMFCIIFICGYVAYHNKQKILALVVEGRRGRRPSRTRRPNSANYRKLDSNLEEAVTSTCNKSAPQVIY